jgi:flagellar FliL protein
MADDNQEQKNSGNGKGLLIALIGLVIFLIIAVIGGGYFLYSHALANNGAQQEHHEEVKKEEAVDKGGSFKADVSDIVLNLTDSKGKDKIMKLSFSIKSSEPTIAALVEESKPEIVDKVISQISSRSSEELMTVGGKNLLKDELLHEINNIINEAGASKKPEVIRNNVKQVLFTTFVIK